MVVRKVRETFEPRETELMIHCLDLAIASAKRATKTKQLDAFKEVVEKQVEMLESLRLKILGLRN